MQVGEVAELRVQLAIDAVLLLAIDEVLILRETELTLRQAAGGANAAAEALAGRIDEDVRNRGERRNHECAGAAAGGKAALCGEVAVERRDSESAIGGMQLRAVSIARGKQHVVRIGLVAPEDIRRIVAIAVLDRGVRAVD